MIYKVIDHRKGQHKTIPAILTRHSDVCHSNKTYASQIYRNTELLVTNRIDNPRLNETSSVYHPELAEFTEML